MKYLTLVILLLVMATLFSTVHAQEVTSDAAPAHAESETTNSDEKQNESITNSENDSSAEIKSSNSVDAASETEISDAKKIDALPAVDSAEIIPVESGRKHRVPKIVSMGNNDPCAIPGGCTPIASLPAAPAPCLVSDTIGCPIDPCLAADSVLCQPQPEPPIQTEEDSSNEDVSPLFSFNPLWVVGPVKPSNPSAGTLVTTPIPIELTETGPNPFIIGQADGRSVPAVEFTPAPAAVTSPLTGLFSGANLPWLGLLVLLVFGIFAWRGRKQ